MQAALRLFSSFWSWITWECRLYLVTCSPLFPHLAVKWALWRLRSLSVFRCEISSKCFKVFANGCCSDSTRLATNNNKEAARVLKVLFSFVWRVETAAPFFSLMLKRDPKHSFRKRNSLHRARFFLTAAAYCFYFPFSVVISLNLLSFSGGKDFFFFFSQKKKKNAVTMQWKELFLCSTAFFSCTEKQIVHAVQFQWPYCGFWQRHRMTVWHLHCSAKIAPAVSPFAFKMPSLLAFYQPSDSGVTAGQAPSSAGLQWHARHQILCARARSKGRAVWDK